MEGNPYVRGYAWDMGAPLHLLAMSTYFYGNELLVQPIRIPLGVPVGVPMVQRGVGVYVSPACILRLYRSYQICQHLFFYLLYS